MPPSAFLSTFCRTTLGGRGLGVRIWQISAVIREVVRDVVEGLFWARELIGTAFDAGSFRYRHVYVVLN